MIGEKKIVIFSLVTQSGKWQWVIAVCQTVSPVKKYTIFCLLSLLYLLLFYQVLYCKPFWKALYRAYPAFCQLSFGRLPNCVTSEEITIFSLSRHYISRLLLQEGLYCKPFLIGTEQSLPCIWLVVIWVIAICRTESPVKKIIIFPLFYHYASRLLLY